MIRLLSFLNSMKFDLEKKEESCNVKEIFNGYGYMKRVYGVESISIDFD